MSPFDHLSVPLSIVLGLGMSHLLSGGAQLVRFRASVRFGGPVPRCIALLLSVHVQVWWAIYEHRGIQRGAFFDFLLVLLIPTLLYLLTYLLLPDFDRERQIDLEAGYFDHRRWLFGTLALIPAVSLAQELAISGEITPDGDLGFRIGFLALALLGLGTPNRTVHRVLAPVSPAVFTGYIVVLFWELG